MESAPPEVCALGGLGREPAAARPTRELHGNSQPTWRSAARRCQSRRGDPRAVPGHGGAVSAMRSRWVVDRLWTGLWSVRRRMQPDLRHLEGSSLRQVAGANGCSVAIGAPGKRLVEESGVGVVPAAQDRVIAPWCPPRSIVSGSCASVTTWRGRCWRAVVSSSGELLCGSVGTFTFVVSGVADPG